METAPAVELAAIKGKKYNKAMPEGFLFGASALTQPQIGQTFLGQQ